MTLTRESDQKIWSLSSKSGAGYLHIDSSGMGEGPAIIFRPDGVSSYDGTYTLQITGLKASNGQPVEDFSYQVSFFNDEGGNANITTPSTTPAATPNDPTPINTTPSNKTPGSATRFKEVDSTYWASASIEQMVKRGVVSGYSNGTFKPANSVTSAHFNAMMARAFHQSELDRIGTRSA